ncbi:MAG TPA: BON domain-containing protein [Vicinamibacterales bacterium]|nr:BON domain-containing protein [Vicinamibacterales bacterium]
MRHPGILLVVLAAATAGCDRPIEIQPQAVEDAQVGVRVKTALVNDAQLGPRVIEVRVTRGLVILSGAVASDEEAARAIEIARAVPGVTDVRSQLVVRQLSELRAPADGGDELDRPVRPDDEIVSASRRRLLAIGGSVNAREPSDTRLASTLSVGPLIRLGTGRGLGVTTGFSWFQTDLSPDSSPGRLGRITIRPVMGGLSYTFTDQSRVALSLSMVGGMAFNSFTLTESTPRDVLALEVDNSVAARPGVSLWVDLNSRAALNVFTGYVITRPQITFLEHGAFVRRSVRADTAVFNVGLAYKVF